MKNYQLYILSFLSGILLAFSWLPYGFAPMLFIAFVPLLFAEHHIHKNAEKYSSFTIVGCSFLAFFTWNTLVTWWIKNASFGGAAMAILSNSVFMTVVFILFHRTKKRIGEKWGYVTFLCFWIAFEFLHHDWDLSWPWLTLGNAFAAIPSTIQWYEFTGIFGGSLWVLAINIFFLKIILSSQNRKKNGIAIIAFFLIPILTSFLIKSSYNSGIAQQNKYEVVVVQPNVDPYNEKFIGNYQEQLKKMLVLANQKVDTTTDYLIFPETALTEDIWESELGQSWSIQTLQEYLKHYPKLKIIIGANTAKVFSPGEKLSETARKFTNDEAYYDAYNTALQLDNSGKIQVYHKSKLVAGVEKMPFPSIFKYFEKFAIDLGGTTGSLGVQNERTVFSSYDNKLKVAPVICYESVYGEYVSEYVSNGAEFIAIITNDGWWGDTPGYKQHVKYGALRAIETRRWIARSANTGISCFISPSGEIIQATPWWQPAVINQKISLSSQITFYTKYGDYLARAAMYASLLLLIYSLLIRFRILKK